MDSVTRKLHQATRRSPARGTSERLGTRVVRMYDDRQTDRPTYKPQLTSSSVGIAQARPNNVISCYSSACLKPEDEEDRSVRVSSSGDRICVRKDCRGMEI